MLVYQSFGEFTKEAYKVYTTAEHLAAYREDYPTRRRQLNAVKKDIENMRHAVDFIAEQLAPINAHFARFMGNKYTALDLYDMQKDLQNLEAAREEIKNTPCPAKAAAQEKKTKKTTIEHPAALTAFDLETIFKLASDKAHELRMQAHQEFQDGIKNNTIDTAQLDAAFLETEKKCNYLSELFNAANSMRDQVSKAAPFNVLEYVEKTKYIKE